MTDKGGFILNRENLDELIKQYADALEFMGQTYGGEAKKVDVVASESPNEEALIKTTTDSNEEENTVAESEMASEEAEDELSDKAIETVDTEPAVKEPATEAAASEATSTADFSAGVFYGEGAFPVKGAKLVIYREDDIYAFLETDENGSTKRITLPAFNKENSLESDNPDQSIDYFADVFAEGFISQRGLLVSSVGGSDIFLRVLLVPESERIG